MQKKEELIQNFKTAIASTTKSVSNVKDIEVIFGNEKLKTNKNREKEVNYLCTKYLKYIYKFCDSKLQKTFQTITFLCKEIE